MTSLAVIGAAALAAAAAPAATLDVSYTATVSTALGTSANSGYANGATITGNFLIDTVTENVTGSTLGTFAAPAGTIGTSSINSTDAIFQQGTFASGGASGSLNDSITVDFSALTSFAATDPVAFLMQSPTALAQQIDFTGASSLFPSTVTYYLGDSTGSNITQVDAYLDGVTVQTVPLPGAVLLMASGVGLGGIMGLARRRRVRPA
jgi:hypothetical protein